MRLKSTFKLVLWFYVSISSVVSQGECPNGLDKPFQNSCYEFVNDKKEWGDAENECAEDKAHLVYIESSEEQQFITDWLKYIDGRNLWIGLIRQNNNLMWSDGSPVNYTAWAPGEPDNDDCVRLRRDEDYRWDDRDCDNDYRYICEIEVPIETTPEPTTTPEGPTTAPEANMPSRKSEIPTTSHATTNIEGTRQPAKGLAPGAIVGVVISIILLLLVIPVMLIVIRCIRSRGNTQTEQTKQEKTDVQLVNGTYDQRIEGTTNHSRQSITQPIYTIIDDNKKPNQYINSSLNISSGVNESSTDENAGVVYEDVSKYENQGAVVNDNDQETSLYYAKSNAQLTTSKTREEIEADRVNKDGPPPDISGYSAGGEGSSDVLHAVKNSHDSKQEGWVECALYGENDTDGADDNEEEWAENKIYAGSDSES